MGERERERERERMRERETERGGKRGRGRERASERRPKLTHAQATLQKSSHHARLDPRGEQVAVALPPADVISSIKVRRHNFNEEYLSV